MLHCPRTLQEQHVWLAIGTGYRIGLGQEQPGDLIFINSYLGPAAIGHVAMVWNPATLQTIEAANPRRGVIIGSYAIYTPGTISQMPPPQLDALPELAAEALAQGVAVRERGRRRPRT